MQGEGSTFQVFDQRGQVLEVVVAGSPEHTPVSDGSSLAKASGHRTLLLDGEEVRMLDDETFEVVRTGQRLSTYPPLSGG